MNNAITVNTRFNIDEIRQEVRSSDDIRGNIHEHIMNLRDQGVREALKKLGWTPPDEESAQNQLCARNEELEQERDALAAHVERQRETLQWVWDKVNLGGWAHERVKSALADTPETSLALLKAQWQAEALEELASDFAGEIYPHTVKHRAKQIHRQAKGGEA